MAQDGQPIPEAGARLDELEEADLPRRFGRYVLRGIVGRGGMGQVFRAELQGPAGFSKMVALKVIHHPPGGDSAAAREEFAREARIGGLLRHPNIVDVYDFGFQGEQPWLALELVDGRTLAELIAGGPVPPVAALELALQILDGLSFAHGYGGEDSGLVHRDIKPSNVMVTVQGGVKVMDFGLARFADTTERSVGWIRATPAYMSPEQASGTSVGAPSDLFSFGLLLYELVTGQRVLGGEGLAEIVFSLINLRERVGEASFAAPLDERIPGLAPLLVACLQAEPSSRPPSARALVGPLRALLSRLPPGPGLRAWLEGAPAGATDLGSDTTVALVSALPSGSIERPGNIGPEVDAFVGRQEDLERLEELLTAARLVTVLGPGGTGKTRLVRRFGRGWIDGQRHPRGGIWFCDLAEAFTVPAILKGLASVFDVPLDREAHEGRGVERLGAALAGRGPTLLILDNFEQIVEYGPATISRWLEAAPELRILVTSRELLRLSGERVLDLAPLPIADGLRLFVERAGDARTGYEPSAAELEEIEEIVGRLDGIPLAIELAAARCSMLSAGQILERLERRFALLSGRARDRGARQATLRGAIDWSWNLLEPWEQAALASCAVFRGSFDLEQAERVIDLDGWPDAPWVMDVVQALRDKSLLRSHSGQSGAPRFGLYESIREYAGQKLDQLGGREADEDRHAQVFLKLGEALVEGLRGAGARQARRELDLVLDNVVAVRARYEVRDPERSARALLVLCAVYRISGPLDAEAELLEHAVERSSTVDPGLRCRLLMQRAHFRIVRGRVPGARSDVNQALDTAREAGDREAEVLALQGVAYIEMHNDVPAATRAAEAALALAQSIGGRRSLAESLSCLGFCRSYQERYDEVERVHRHAHRLFEALGDQRMVAVQLNCIAIVCAGRREIEVAEHLFDEARRVNRELGYARGEAQCLGNLGIIAIQRARYVDAEEALSRAIQIDRLIGDLRAASLFVVNLGYAVLLQGRRADAAPILDDGLALTRANKAVEGLTVALRAQAALAIRDGDFQGAQGMLREVLTLEVRAPWSTGQVASRCLLFLAVQGTGADATEELGLARALAASGDEEERAMLHLCLTWAGLLSDVSVADEASACWRRWGFVDDVDVGERAPEAIHHLVHMLVGELLDEKGSQIASGHEMR